MDYFFLLLAVAITAAHVAGWTLAGGPYLVVLKARGYDRKAFLSATGRKNEYGVALTAGWKRGAVVQIGCFLALVAMLIGDGLRNPQDASAADLQAVSGLLYLLLWAAVVAISGIAVFVVFQRLPERRARKPEGLDPVLSRASGTLLCFALVLFLVETAALFAVGPYMARMAVMNSGGGTIGDNRSFMFFLSGLVALQALISLCLQILNLKLLPPLAAAAGWVARLVGRDGRR